MYFLLIAILHPECLASFQCIVLTVAWHLCLRVDTANEAIHELVAEPTQKQQTREPQADEAVEPVPEEDANPADLQGKPRSITPSFNIQCLLYKYLCIYVLGVVWNPSMHVLPRYRESILVFRCC